MSSLLAWRALRSVRQSLGTASVNVALSVAVPLLLFAIVAWWSWANVQAEAGARVERMAATVAEHARRVIETQETILEAVLSFAQGKSREELANDPQVHEFLRRLEIRAPSTNSTSLVDLAQGRILASSLSFPAPDVNLSSRDYLDFHRRHASATTYIGEAIRGAASGRISFTVSRYNPKSGYLAVTLVPRDSFLQFYSDAREGSRDALTLARADGAALVIGTAPDPVGFRLPANSAFMRFLRGEIAAPHHARSAVDGIDRLWSYTKVGDYPVYALYGLDYSRINQAWLRQLLPFGLVTALGTLLLLASAVRARKATAARQRAEAEAQWARVRAEQAQTLARQADMLDQSSDAILAWKIGGPITYWSRGAEALYGYTRAQALGRRAHELLRTNAAIAEDIERRLDADGQWSGELTQTARDGRSIDVECRLKRVVYGEERYALASNRDVTERKRAEERVSLLMREVSHRSKNMLSLIQAVARQTIASSPDEFLAKFGDRIRAIAASQDLLLNGAWDRVPLDRLVAAQLAHFGDLIGTRILVDGPPLAISASAAQNIGMALHELATNAGKYGALSNGEGRVAISWALRTNSAAPSFSITWAESGGPPVSPPEQRGFGSTVISAMVRMALGAEVALDYAATGFVWRLACPADSVLDPDRNGAADPSDPALPPPAHPTP